MGLVHRGNKLYLYQSERSKRVRLSCDLSLLRTRRRSPGTLVRDPAGQGQEEAGSQAAGSKRSERDRQEDRERQIVESLHRGDDFFSQAMTAAGFYKYKREWRKMGKQHIQNVVSAFNYEVEAETPAGCSTKTRTACWLRSTAGTWPRPRWNP